MALPRDLSRAESLALVREFVKEQFTDHGLICDIGIHSKKASDGLENLHAHILLTTRPLNARGKFVKVKDSAKKRSHWNSRQRIHEWRSAWADKQNEAFERLGLDVRVSPYSYRNRGMNRIPQKHFGPKRWAQELRGIRTAIGNINRKIAFVNRTRKSTMHMKKRTQAKIAEVSTALKHALNAPSHDEAERQRIKEEEKNPYYER